MHRRGCDIAQVAPWDSWSPTAWSSPWTTTSTRRRPRTWRGGRRRGRSRWGPTPDLASSRRRRRRSGRVARPRSWPSYTPSS